MAFDVSISYWSSDVCSSDLCPLPARRAGGQIWLHRSARRPSLTPRRQALPLLGRQSDRLDGRGRGNYVAQGRRNLCRRDGAAGRDRNGVVQGKRGSDRGDLGGRRVRNKQKTNK